MLESKLSEDRVYIDYCKKIEKQEELKERIAKEDLTKKEEKEIKKEIKKLQKDIDYDCEELRRKI